MKCQYPSVYPLTFACKGDALIPISACVCRLYAGYIWAMNVLYAALCAHMQLRVPAPKTGQKPLYPPPVLLRANPVH